MSKGSSLCVSVYRVTEWSLTCSTFYSAHIIPARKDDIFEGAQVESMLEAVLGGYHGTIVSEMGRLCDEAWGCTVCTRVAQYIGEHSMLDAICHSLVSCPLTCAFVQRATSFPCPSFYYS